MTTVAMDTKTEKRALTVDEQAVAALYVTKLIESGYVTMLMQRALDLDTGKHASPQKQVAKMTADIAEELALQVSDRF